MASTWDSVVVAGDQQGAGDGWSPNGCNQHAEVNVDDLTLHGTGAGRVGQWGEPRPRVR